MHLPKLKKFRLGLEIFKQETVMGIKKRLGEKLVKLAAKLMETRKFPMKEKNTFFKLLTIAS